MHSQSNAEQNHQYLQGLSLDPELRRRILITLSCNDCEYIPKVPYAGQVFVDGNVRYQLMHNGVRVIEGCYYGDWMTELIRLSQGHHEPQEEKVFYEILKYVNVNSTMIEVGSFWAYYSLWFKHFLENATTYLIEPDPNNLAVGKENFRLNKMEGQFHQFSIGRKALNARPFHCESDGVERSVPETSVDHFVAVTGIEKIEILLADVQGAEFAMLEGMVETIKLGKLRFLFLSTHHHSISGDALTHQRCLEFLKNHHANIIAVHNVTESYSGDGLIVAAFDEQDRTISPVKITKNYPTNSLFRELEYDLHDARQELLKLKQSTGIVSLLRGVNRGMMRRVSRR